MKILMDNGWMPPFCQVDEWALEEELAYVSFE